MVLFQFANFPFDQIKLSNPQPMQGGGSYFTKMTINEDPITIQFPRCKTKTGIVSTKKYKYTDLMFRNINTSLIHQWIENLENKCKFLLDEKKNIWFMNDLTSEDIETMTTPISRVYKNGKFILLRMILNSFKRFDNLDEYQLFDQKKCKIEDKALSNEEDIIPLVVLEGIKFTASSIDIEFKITQIMILDKEDKNLCLIKNHGEDQTKKINLSDLKDNEKYSEDEDEDENENKDKDINKEKDLNIEKNINLEDKNLGEETENLENKTEEKEKEGEFKDILNEICLDKDKNINHSDVVILRKPNEIYYELYKEAREKAKQLKKSAINAYLNAKHIKDKYMLDEIEDSGEEDFSQKELELI